MSYLARIAARAAGSRSTVPAIVPKGILNRQAPRIARIDEADEEEDSVAPMRRFGATAMRREQTDSDSEEVPEEQARSEENRSEEEVAALRRQEQQEEEVAPLRRQEQEQDDEEAVMPMRAIARQEEIPLEEAPKSAPSRSQTDLESDEEPVSDDLAVEQEPSDLQALRRDVGHGPAPSPATSQTEAPMSRPQPGRLAPFQTEAHGVPTEFPTPQIVPPTTGVDPARPRVVIEQLDVLIHEPVAPSTRTEPRKDRHKALQARYLRRL